MWQCRESAIQRGRVQISSINDYTTDKVEIELELSRGVRADDVIPQLYAYTDCAVAVNSNLTVVRDRKPVEMTVSEVLRERGYTAADAMTPVIDGTGHSEADWAARLDGVLGFLMGAR